MVTQRANVEAATHEVGRYCGHSKRIKQCHCELKKPCNEPTNDLSSIEWQCYKFR